jgi:methionyl-tRNA synthetase
MLESAGVALPERVWAHGFVSLGGERFSKSAGVKLELSDAVDRFGPDAFRYFLLREVPFDGDGSFTWERFEERYNADLANAFGNLASRVISMVEKYFDGVVPRGEPGPLDARAHAHLEQFHARMDGSSGYLLNEGLEVLWRLVAEANEYVAANAPWALAKDPARRDELASVMAALTRQLARLAVSVAPFIPGKAQELWEQLGAPGAGLPDVHAVRFDALSTLDVAGWRVTKGAPLFPRAEPRPATGAA